MGCACVVLKSRLDGRRKRYLAASRVSHSLCGTLGDQASPCPSVRKDDVAMSFEGCVELSLVFVAFRSAHVNTRCALERSPRPVPVRPGESLCIGETARHGLVSAGDDSV